MTIRNCTRTLLGLAAVAMVGLAITTTSANADIVASTDFNGRTATDNVASDLNWTTNGVDDPGTMSASIFGGGAQNLFDGTTFTQNSFTPGINTGNGNTSWVTTVNLTVSSGSTVTLDDVSFGYWAINGGQAQNVDRLSDFEVKVFNPSAVQVGSTVSIDDVNNGTTISPGLPTPVVATFGSSIALTDPGTYTVEIRGGDFSGSNETGNHTGIDNLTFNGTVTSAIPEPSSLALLGLGGLGMLVRRRQR